MSTEDQQSLQAALVAGQKALKGMSQCWEVIRDQQGKGGHRDPLGSGGDS